MELVRAGQQLEAIAYARRHLAPWAGQHMQELQRAAALLAFQAGTQCAPYRQLFEEERVRGAPRQPDSLPESAWARQHSLPCQRSLVHKARVQLRRVSLAAAAHLKAHQCVA